MIYQTTMVGRDAEEFDSGYGESSRYAAHLDRGWALLDRGDVVAARTSVEHAQEVRPDDPDASVLLGAIALAEGDATEALRCYERALELDPEYLEPYVAAAQVCLFDLEDPARALRFCEDALELERLGPFELADLTLLSAECQLAQDDKTKPELGNHDDFAVVVATLELAARGPQRADLDAEDPAAAAAAEYLLLDHDGEALDDEERTDRTARAFQLVMRWARLRLDLGETDVATAQLRDLTSMFPEEADAWYLLGEAHLRNQDVRRAAEASLRTLELDARSELPAWLPSASIIQRRVLQALRRADVSAIRDAVTSDQPIALLIQERPAPELVAEGIDPRLPALSLGTKSDPAAEQLTLTGLAIYVANIARVCRDTSQFEDELRLSITDELEAFFQGPGPGPEPSAEVDDDKKPTRRKRRRSRAKGS